MSAKIKFSIVAISFFIFGVGFSYLFQRTLANQPKDDYRLQNAQHFAEDSHTSKTVYADPFQEMEQMHKQMEKRMNRFLGASPFEDAFWGSSMFRSFPKIPMNEIIVNETEDATHKYIELNVKGLLKDSLDVKVENSMIFISGENRVFQDEEEGNHRSRSSMISSFQKTFNVPYGVDSDKVEIELKNNQVVLKFPKLNVS